MLKNTLPLFIFFFFLQINFSYAQYDYETLQYNGENAIDIVFVGDGFTLSEQDFYDTKVLEAYINLFNSNPPFDSRQSDFNVYSVTAISEESGLSEKGGVTYDTAFDSYYEVNDGKISIDTSEIDTKRKLRNYLKEYFDKDVYVIMLLNSPITAGHGDRVTPVRPKIYLALSTLSTTKGAFKELVSHELGHSFGKLADEYGGDCSTNTSINGIPFNFYDADNVTYDNVDDRKWDNLVDDPQYFLGANYCDDEWYRSSEDGLMRSVESGQQHNELGQILINNLIDKNIAYNEKVVVYRQEEPFLLLDEDDRNIRIYADEITLNQDLTCDNLYIKEDSTLIVEHGVDINCNEIQQTGTIIYKKEDINNKSVVNRTSSRDRVIFGCKDTRATNYSPFVRHNQSLCRYQQESNTDTNNHNQLIKLWRLKKEILS